MRSEKTGRGRVIIPGLIMLVFLGLLLCGILKGQRTVYQPGEAGELTALTVSEFALVVDATVGGVERDEEGRLVRTYRLGEAPPEECPT